MQPLVVNAADVAELVGRMWWPSLRIGGFVLAAPIASEATIPRRIKIVLVLALTVLVAPLVSVPTGLSIFTGPGAVAAVHEVIIGVAIGMVMQLAFDAVNLAGQTISMSMGLGFATLVDPQRGSNVTVLGQLVMMTGTLAYLAVDGHMLLLGALAGSFRTLPIGAAMDHGFLLSVAEWGGRIFETGMLVALPAITALVIVSIALGVVSRTAPALNLFGIGFTVTMLAGFFVLLVGLDGMMSGISRVIDGALTAVNGLVSGPVTGTH